ncbi:hypothetical protein QYE76_000058 [Lolium multiflorum]|uniref:Uncharacterized protein n=1 Tax=Lolium multiflorum TaxID=4521 RepID=A0AAD8Q978_LOLMU|nr:hypothetical protein QYE76_000058 [Lolium multiflorum]
MLVPDASEVLTVQRPKRPSGGFADEDELLFESDEVEVAPPPLKKAKTGSNKEVMTETEESTPPEGAVVAPSPPKRSQTKGKEVPSTAASPSSTPEVHLQRAAKSSSDQLEQAFKLLAAARREADKLKKELNQLKTKLKEEEKQKAEAQAHMKEKEDSLRKSIEALPDLTDMVDVVWPDDDDDDDDGDDGANVIDVVDAVVVEVAADKSTAVSDEAEDVAVDEVATAVRPEAI